MKIRITKLPGYQVGGGLSCPEGFHKDETGQCVEDNGFENGIATNMDPTQEQQKGMPITGATNAAGEHVGGTGAQANKQGYQNANPALKPTITKKPFDWGKLAGKVGAVTSGFSNAIGGVGALADMWSNQQDMKAQNNWIHQQLLNTNAINPIHDRGDYDINTGMFRPNQDVVNKGMYSNKFYSEFGGPVFQNGGGFYNPIGQGLDPSYTPLTPLLASSTQYNISNPDQGYYEPFGNSLKSNIIKSNPGFKSFATKEEGMQALKNQLNLYKTGKTRVGLKPDSTLYEAMAKYAPSSDNNNPKKYAEFIAKKLGISASTPIKDVNLEGWANAIAKMEGNTKGNNPGNIRQFNIGGQNNNTMKIRIVGGPKMTNGGDTPSAPYSGQSDYGLYIGQRNLYNTMAKNAYSDPSQTISEDKTANPQDFALEAEGGEKIKYPNGGLMNISGPSHADGGVKLTNEQAPEGSFIYSKTKKMFIKDPEVLAHFGMSVNKKGYSPAQIAAKFPVNKPKAILEDSSRDNLAKSTAKLQFEGWDKKLAELALIQESMKGFPNGIPDVAKSLMKGNEEQGEQVPDNEQGENMPSAKYGGSLPFYQYAGPVQSNTVNDITAGNINDIGGIGNMMEGRNITTWAGDKIQNKANASRLIPAQIAAKIKALGYSGPMDTPSIMKFLYENPQHPEWKSIIDQEHQSKPGNIGGIYNEVAGKPTFKWGYRWDMALNKIPIPPTNTPGTPVQSTPSNPPSVLAAQTQTNNAAGPKPPNIIPPKGSKQKGPGQPPFFSYDMFVGPQQEKTFAAARHSEIPMPTFYDPTRELGQNSENAAMLANVSGQYTGAQGLGSRLSAIQAKTAEEQANTLARYSKANVDTANQFAPLQTGIINAEGKDNADRADMLFYNQEQTKKDFRNQLAKYFGKAGKIAATNYDIRSKTQMLNATNPYFHINYGPRNASLNFNPGVDQFGNITGAYNFPGSQGQQGSSSDAYMKAIMGYKSKYPNATDSQLHSMYTMDNPNQGATGRGNQMQQYLNAYMQSMNQGQQNYNPFGEQ